MNLRKEAIDVIRRELENSWSNARSELQSNLWAFKKLTEKQTILKRKCSEIKKAINYLEARKKKVSK